MARIDRVKDQEPARPQMVPSGGDHRLQVWQRGHQRKRVVGREHSPEFSRQSQGAQIGSEKAHAFAAVSNGGALRLSQRNHQGRRIDAQHLGNGGTELPGQATAGASQKQNRFPKLRQLAAIEGNVGIRFNQGHRRACPSVDGGHPLSRIM